MKKEQQKQHLIDMMRSDEELGLYDEQETLEEVAERFLKDGARKFKTEKQVLIGFAKWQQQQNNNLYSEDEVLHILTKFSKFVDVINEKNYLNQWFEQFKKK